MDLGAQPFDQRAVGSVAEERMTKAEGGLVDEPSLRWERELSRYERGQPLGGRIDIRVEERGHGAAMEEVPFHGRTLDRVPLRRRQSLSPRRR